MRPIEEMYACGGRDMKMEGETNDYIVSEHTTYMLDKKRIEILSKQTKIKHGCLLK